MADPEDDSELSLSQETRPLRIETPLDDEPLLLTEFSGAEGLSQLFRFEMSFISEQDDIDFSDLLGKKVSVSVDLPNDSSRTWNGVLTQFGQNGRDDWFNYYSAVMEPSIIELTLRSNFRVFQDQKVDELLDTLLDGFETRTSYAHADDRLPRNYCVQYGESDFAFASRLMEEVGIFYYFEHSDGKDTLVLTDDAAECKAVEGLETLDYVPPGGGVHDEASIKRWQRNQRLTPASVRLRDTHFQTPSESFEATRDIDQTIDVGEESHTLRPEESDRVIYSYPGGYASRYDDIARQEQDPEVDEDADSAADLIRNDADRESRLLCELLTSQSLRIDAESDVLPLLPGGLFTLAKHYNADGEYLVTRMVHKVTLGVGSGSGDSDDSLDYSNEFTCQPSGLAYRAARQTPKPVVTGVQTATVVADLTANEEDPSKLCEQFYDKYGRVKVRFAWDCRDDSSPDDPDAPDTAGVADRSCWVRVAQIWAGNGWGAFFWPRHGHEVLVAFEHGDPDRPVIVGSLYNAANQPPLAMPEKQMFAGIMSCSVNGEASESSNGFTFHDLLGNEHFETHSESNSFSLKEDSEHSIVLGTSVSVNGTLMPW